MLYQLYDWQRAAMEPWRYLAQVGTQVYGNPQSPWAALPGSRNAAAAFDLMNRLTQDYARPPFGIETVTVGKRELKVREERDLEKPFCTLLHFSKAGAPKQRRVLIVAPLSGHFATLLRDTVSAMLADHDVWITDWKDAKEIPVAVGPFHFDDYVAYVREFITFLGAADLNVVSVCQPTVPVLAAVSLMASSGEKTPRTLTMMGGPIDARCSPTAVNNLATQNPLSWFENNVIHTVPPGYPGAGRRVYPGFLQHAGFLSMNPSRHFSSHWDFYADLVKGDMEDADAHRRFYDEYNAVLDMPARYYLDTIRVVFQEFLLPRCEWYVQGELVDPGAITGTALLSIEGELDDIAGLGQTEAAQELCTGIPAARREHFVVEGAGHYGIFSGRRWRETVYPKVRDFFAANAQAAAKPKKAAKAASNVTPIRKKAG